MARCVPKGGTTHKPNRTMKHVMIAAAFCFGIMGAQAQTTPTTDPAKATPAMQATHPAHNCMGASEKDWASLNLTAEQTTKVKAIQAECQKECGAMMKDDPSMGKAMDKHEARIKAVLTPAQYDNWMKWCTAQVDTKEAPQKK
jgi:Spy/CpxP family protein refolding chaperone